MCCIKMLTIVLVALAVSSTVSTLKVGRPRTNEIKQGQTFSLCGDTFVMAWKYMCKFKYQRSLQKNKLRSRSKRSVESKFNIFDLKFIRIFIPVYFGVKLAPCLSQ